MNSVFRSELQLGDSVSISLQKRRGTIVEGVIKEVLTNSDSHPHGILVALTDGNIGRVQAVLTKKTDNPLDVPDDLVPNTKTPEEELDDILALGEIENIEFKSSALWSKNYTRAQIEESKSWMLKKYGQDASKIIIAKTLAAFLNTNGGNLIIGIKENKSSDHDEIIGVESEFGKLSDKCVDGYRRMIVDYIIKKYFPDYVFNHFGQYLTISFPKKDSKALCRIHAQKSDKKVFLKINNKEYFFIRTDAETRELDGKAMVDYCEERFK